MGGIIGVGIILKRLRIWKGGGGFGRGVGVRRLVGGNEGKGGWRVEGVGIGRQAVLLMFTKM